MRNTPLSRHSISSVAFSPSRVNSASPGLTDSPSCLSQPTKTPSSMFQPRRGIVISTAIATSGCVLTCPIGPIGLISPIGPMGQVKTQPDVAMAVEITIPRLGWNMEEGVFVGWLKQDGESVNPGDALFTLEGEKATEEIECLDKGVLRIAPGGPNAGDKVAVGAVIGYVAEANEEWGARSAGAIQTETIPAPSVSVMAPAVQAPRHHQTASPRARRVARELGVDWKQVPGGGRTGRIRERDVRAAADAAPTQTAITPLRKTIAERMTVSMRSTAPVTLTTTVDASNLVNLRNQFKASGNNIIPSYTDFLVKLVAAALQKHPMLSAPWTVSYTHLRAH